MLINSSKLEIVFELFSALTPTFEKCRIRFPYPWQWGAPKVEAGEAFVMMAAALVSLVEVAICSPNLVHVSLLLVET